MLWLPACLVVNQIYFKKSLDQRVAVLEIAVLQASRLLRQTLTEGTDKRKTLDLRSTFRLDTVGTKFLYVLNEDC